MPIRTRENFFGFIDPITTIGVLFLVITLAVGVVVTKNNKISLNINEKAGTMCGYCNGATCVSCSAGRTDVGECTNSKQCEGGGVPGSVCGNGQCQSGETPQNCPNDCMTSGGPYCGDGNCNGKETPGSCDVDCGNEGPACQPSCGGRACGDDGCGDICGSCVLPNTCNSSGQCTVPGCTPSCTGKMCGDNGCGGNCGTCPGGSTCQFNSCIANQAPIPQDPIVVVPPVDPVITAPPVVTDTTPTQPQATTAPGTTEQTNEDLSRDCFYSGGQWNNTTKTCFNPDIEEVGKEAEQLIASNPIINPPADDYDIESTRNRTDDTAKNIVIPPSLTTTKYTSKAECQANVNPNSKAYEACGQYATSSENQNVILQNTKNLLASLSQIPTSYVSYWQNQTGNQEVNFTNFALATYKMVTFDFIANPVLERLNLRDEADSYLDIAFNQQTTLDTADLLTFDKTSRYVSNYQRINEQTYSSNSPDIVNYLNSFNAGIRDKETLASTIDLGVTMTAEAYALTVAAPLALTSGGVVPGAVSLMGQAQVVSTAMQGGNTTTYCILNGLDENCQQQIARTGLSVATIGVSQYANTFGNALGRFSNTVTTAANFGVDSADAVVAFSDPNTDSLTRAMSLIAVVGDIGGGIGDLKQGQLGFGSTDINIMKNDITNFLPSNNLASNINVSNVNIPKDIPLVAIEPIRAPDVDAPTPPKPIADAGNVADLPAAKPADDVTTPPSLLAKVQEQFEKLFDNTKKNADTVDIVLSKDAETDKLVKYIVGPDVKGVDQLAQRMQKDQNQIINEYGLPPYSSRFKTPDQYRQSLVTIAEQNGISIKPTTGVPPDIRSKLLEIFPSGYIPPFYEKGILYLPNLDSISDNDLKTMVHELTHGLDEKFKPGLSIEQSEYRAYVVELGDAVAVRNSLGDNFTDYVFGQIGVKGSVKKYYTTEGITEYPWNKVQNNVQASPSLLAKVQTKIEDAWVNITEKFKPDAKSTVPNKVTLAESDFKLVTIDSLPKNIQPEVVEAIRQAQEHGITVYSLPANKMGTTSPEITGGAYQVGGRAGFPYSNSITVSESILTGTHPDAARIIYHEFSGHMVNSQVPRTNVAAKILNELLAQQTASLKLMEAGVTKPFTAGFNNIPVLIQRYKNLTGKDPGQVIDIINGRFKLPNADQNTVDGLVIALKMRQADIYRPNEASSEAVQNTINFLKKYGVDTTDMSAIEIGALINRLENPNPPAKLPKKFNSGQGMTGLTITASIPVALGYADQYFDWGITDKVVEIFNNLFGIETIDGIQLDKSITPNASTSEIEGYGSNNLAKYLIESPEVITPEDIVPPEGLTKTVEGRCQRVDRSNPCDGNRMYEMYLWYKSQPDGWWYTNGEFTPADFLGLMLVSEAGSGDTEFLKAITTASSSQLWGSSAEHQPYCTTSDCEAGIFNFIGAYMQSASRRYNEIVLNENGNRESLVNVDKTTAGNFARNGIDLRKIANDTIYNPVSKTYDNDTPVHWGNFGCGAECEYLGPNWIKDRNQAEVQTGTTDRCGLYDMYGTDGVLAVVFTNNQKYNWTSESSECFK